MEHRKRAASTNNDDDDEVMGRPRVRKGSQTKNNVFKQQRRGRNKMQKAVGGLSGGGHYGDGLLRYLNKLKEPDQSMSDTTMGVQSYMSTDNVGESYAFPGPVGAMQMRTPSPTKKAFAIVSSVLEYGVENGILTRTGNSFWINHIQESKHNRHHRGNPIVSKRGPRNFSSKLKGLNRSAMKPMGLKSNAQMPKLGLSKYNLRSTGPSPNRYKIKPARSNLKMIKRKYASGCSIAAKSKYNFGQPSKKATSCNSDDDDDDDDKNDGDNSSKTNSSR